MLVKLVGASRKSLLGSGGGSRKGSGNGGLLAPGGDVGASPDAEAEDSRGGHHA